MTDLTGILNAIEQADPQASEDLLPRVYDELRRPRPRLVNEKFDQSHDQHQSLGAD